MDSRTRVRTVLQGGIPDRVPADDSYWDTTLERWQREGMPAGVAPATYFDNDIVRIAGDYTLRFPVRVVSEDARSRTYWDSNGALRRDLHLQDGWTSQWLDFTIKSPEDWRHHRHRAGFDEGRIDEGSLREYAEARARGKAVLYSGHAVFHPTWEKIGMEHQMMLMLDKPDFVHEIFGAQAKLMVDIYEGFRRRGVEFDGVFLADDLGYRVSPLISPELYRLLVMPYHRSLCAYFAERGLVTTLHSDGNIEPLIPLFIEAGFRGLHPLEAKCGLDVRDLKPRFGKQLVFWGNIDARKLSGSPAEIEEEIRGKLPVAMHGGGYIYHSDHSVPHTVSLESYRLARDLVSRVGRYG
jgi:uroporphyrinogen decarboxylase